MTELAFPDPPLQAGGVRLRPFGARDVPSIVAALSDRETVRFMPNLVRDYEEADAHHWLAGREPARLAGEGLAFAVTNAKTDGLLGSVAVETNLVHGTAVLAYWLAPVARGNGYMTTSVRLVCGWWFDVLGMGRVELTTDPDNVASQRVAERVGFRQEGLMRGHLRDPDTGARLSSILWGLLPGELTHH
jgi:RimJ/RimL family protein N-acetyltransferase